MSSIHSAFSNAYSDFRKVCYRGIAKNLNRLQVSFALVNLYMKRRTLMRCAMA